MLANVAQGVIASSVNRVVVGLIHAVLREHGIDPAVAFLAPPQREYLTKILQATDTIDLAIPRGSKALIDFVRDNARVPVIETGAGIVHTYVDKSADLEQAKAVITNAKVRRPSVTRAASMRARSGWRSPSRTTRRGPETVTSIACGSTAWRT